MASSVKKTDLVTLWHPGETRKMYQRMDQDWTLEQRSRSSKWMERWFPNPMFEVAKNGNRWEIGIFPGLQRHKTRPYCKILEQTEVPLWAYGVQFKVGEVQSSSIALRPLGQLAYPGEYPLYQNSVRGPDRIESHSQRYRNKCRVTYILCGLPNSMDRLPFHTRGQCWSVCPACRGPACRDPSCRDPSCRDPSCRDPSCRDPSCRDPLKSQQLVFWLCSSVG